jgi:hypothetical protein
MKKTSKTPKKMKNAKLSIPISRNSKFQYGNMTINNSKKISNIQIYNWNPKKTIIKKLIITKCITPMKELKSLNAYEKAEIESNITTQILSKKYRNILQRDNDIDYYLTLENNEIKKAREKEKIKLKENLSKIIKDAMILSKNIEKRNHFSADNKKLKKNYSQLNLRQKKNVELLSELGIIIEELNGKNKFKININKAWNYFNKIKKRKNNKIDDILRYKIVNSILNINEKNMYCKKINKQRTPCNNIKTNANRVQCKRIIRKKKIDEPKNNEIKNKSKMNLSIPFDNNRIRMIEILNRSYNYPTIINDDRNESQANNKKDLEIQIDN